MRRESWREFSTTRSRRDRVILARGRLRNAALVLVRVVSRGSPFRVIHMLPVTVLEFPSVLGAIGQAICGLCRRALSETAHTRDRLMAAGLDWRAAMDSIYGKTDEHSLEISECLSYPTFRGGFVSRQVPPGMK